MRQIASVMKSKNFDKALAAASKRLLDNRELAPALETTARPELVLEIAAETLAADMAPGRPAFSGPPTSPTAGLEAIILAEMRPPYFIINDEIRIEGDFDHVDLIESNKAKLEVSSKQVGRLDLLYHPTHDFVGTGWLIEKDIVVTNRHVAEFFTDIDRAGGYRFKMGVGSDRLVVLLDQVRQHRATIDARRAFVKEVLYMAGQFEPDFAFLRIEPLATAEPLPIASRRTERDQVVAAVGYPAWDGYRNDTRLMAELFGGVYDVKRFAPGLITGASSDGAILRTDYTSLGGNSGSPVVDVATGAVVGLHFSGEFRLANSAVAIDIVTSALRRLRPRIAVEGPAAAPAAAAHAPSHFNNRSGYDPDFLGSGELAVPLPGRGAWSDDIAPVSDDADSVLKYMHFSTVQLKSRRLPLFTAVNIDGKQQQKLAREGDWMLDDRISRNHQIGDELYRRNPFDRGHMVRRRDPGWGSEAEATLGEADTFHYTNSAPQHEDLNQKTWVGLEDYLLHAAETWGFKASIFTGPIFRTTDRRIKNQPGVPDFQIPEEFWKVAVMVNAKTRKLHATAYVLSHGPLIRDLTEAAFVYGKHETYQVKVEFVEAATGLDFGTLRNFDPLAASTSESAFGRAVLRIGEAADLKL